MFHIPVSEVWSKIFITEKCSITCQNVLLNHSVTEHNATGW